MWPFKKKIQEKEKQPTVEKIELTEEQTWRLCLLHDTYQSNPKGWVEKHEYWTYVKCLCGSRTGNVKVTFDKNSGIKPTVTVTSE